MSAFKLTNSNQKQFFYLIPMKCKVRPVFPVYESLTFLLLNKQIQIENEYS